MLWILRPRRCDEDNPWGLWLYDKSMGFVVRADSEAEARALASVQAGDEGQEAWERPEYSECSLLSDRGEPEVILRDFNAG